MRRVLQWFLLLVEVISLVCLFQTGLYAQSIWHNRNHDKTVFLEFMKPSFDPNFYDSTEFITSATFLSVRWPVTERLFIVAELPMSYADFKDNYSLVNEGTLGNLYAGVEVYWQNSPIFLDIGMRIPNAPNPDENKGTAAVVGMFSDYVDRQEAFISQTLPITGMLNYRSGDTSGLNFRLRGGPSLWISGLPELNQEELFFLYSLQTSYESKIASIGMVFSGRTSITEKDYYFDEQNSIYQLGFNASVGIKFLRPGLQFRLPLDKKSKEVLDSVIDFNLTILLK